MKVMITIMTRMRMMRMMMKEKMKKEMVMKINILECSWGRILDGTLMMNSILNIKDGC